MTETDFRSPPRFMFKAATVLTVANLAAAVGNYAFQAIMGRHLPLAEFGYLNSTLSLVTLAGVPLTGASQAVTHHLAKHQATDDREALDGLQVASQKLLNRLTLLLCLVALLVIKPTSDFFGSPRLSLVLVALACIPSSMWGMIGQAWCAGLSRFRLLAGLIITSSAVRLLVGWVGVSGLATAEVGVAATFMAFLVMASGLFLRAPVAQGNPLKSPWGRDFYWYAAAAVAVTLGNFLFLQCDQMVAQRHFPGNELGIYSAAALLGRAVVWAAIPVLMVYFTQRSGQARSTRHSGALVGLYLVAILAGAVAVTILARPLSILLLARPQPEVIALVGRFAAAMIPIGILQAAGYFFLATSRLPECLLFGACSLLYAGVLTYAGTQPQLLIFLMQMGSTLSLIALSIFVVVRWGRTQP